jgi:hypothetical protein
MRVLCTLPSPRYTRMGTNLVVVRISPDRPMSLEVTEVYHPDS